MIKDLISDIANDKITLSQALMRSKMVAFKIKNNTFKEWIKKETEGYELNDELLPEYRKIYSELILVAEFINGFTEDFPFAIPDDIPKETLENATHHFIIESINAVERQRGESKMNEEGRITLPSALIPVLTFFIQKQLLTTLKFNGGKIVRIQRKINTAHYHNVIDQTKNKLIDILLELQEEFPNIENDYIMNDENNKKTQNIVTNNIYGGNVPFNIANGDNANQNITFNTTNIDYDKLRTLGVEESHIEELETIVKESEKDKKGFPSKLIGWLSSVTASVVARGLYDNIPSITEFAQSLMPI